MLKYVILKHFFLNQPKLEIQPLCCVSMMVLNIPKLNFGLNLRKFQSMQQLNLQSAYLLVWYLLEETSVFPETESSRFIVCLTGYY